MILYILEIQVGECLVFVLNIAWYIVLYIHESVFADITMKLLILNYLLSRWKNALSGEITLSKLFCLPYEKRVYSEKKKKKRRNLLPRKNKFFSFRTDTFSNGFNVQKNHKYYLRFTKWRMTYQMYSVTVNVKSIYSAVMYTFVNL